MLQQFESEAGHTSADSLCPHRVGGRARHGSPHQNGPIRQHSQRFAARAGDFDYVQNRPVGRDVATIAQTIGELVAAVGRRREPEISNEVRAAERLGQAEDELRVHGGADVLGRLEHGGHRRSSPHITGPTMRSPHHNAIDQVRHVESALRAVGGGILQDDLSRRGHQHHSLADGIQLFDTRAGEREVTELVELRAKLLADEWCERDHRAHRGEVRIRPWPEGSQKRKRFPSIHTSKESHLSEGALAGGVSALGREEPGPFEAQECRRFPFNEMGESCGMSVGKDCVAGLDPTGSHRTCCCPLNSGGTPNSP